MSTIGDLQLSRICVSLQSDDKVRRKRTLEELEKIIYYREWSTSECAEIWDIVNKQLSRSLTDEAEYCRNTSIEIWKFFLSNLPLEERNIVHVIPILSRRLSCQELLETSEEVRLNCVKLLRLVIEKYTIFLAPYYDDFVAILGRTVTDNYPEIKRESCQCIEDLSKAIPEQFYSRSSNLVKPTLSNFQHQHWKVRVASVRAIGEILLNGHSKSMEEVSTPMAERLFDQSGAVRLAVVEVAGRWLLELRDRYSWWHKLLPLLVTGLHDEIENIRNRAGILWNDAGELYMTENETDEKFKDKMDFLIEDPPHYPPNVKRPNLGCRVIVQQNICRLVAGITNEIGNWLVDIRIRSAQLLCVLVLNAEDEVTQHIEKLLPPMYRACNDEDSRVVVNVELAAEYMGYFVPPSIYCHLVLPTLEEVITAGHLRFFAAILRGSEGQTLRPKLQAIGKFLQQSHVCRSKKIKYQEQLGRCCESLIRVCKSDCLEISQELFTVLFTLVSMCQDDEIRKLVEDLLVELSRLEEFSKMDEFFVSHLTPIFNDLRDTCQAWTIYSAELQIFRVCLTRASLATSLNANVVLTILRTTMSDDSDPELRLKLFILLADYFQRRDIALSQVDEKKNFVDTIMGDVIFPGLVWSAGRAAEAIRTAAICCLCAFLDEDTRNDDMNFREKSYSKKIDDKSERENFHEKLENEKIEETIEIEELEENFDIDKSKTEIEIIELEGKIIESEELEEKIDIQKSKKGIKIVELEEKAIESEKLLEKIDIEKSKKGIEIEELEENAIENKKSLENIEIEELEEKIDVKETKKGIEIVELDEKAIESEKLLEKIDIEKSKKGIEIEELKAIEKKSLENIEIEELEGKIDVKETKKGIEIVELDERAIESEKLLEKIDIEKSKKGIEIEELEEKAIEKKSKKGIEIEELEEKAIEKKSLENIEIEELEEKIDVKETKKEIEIVELDEKAIESEKLLEKIDIEKSKKGIEIEELKAIERKSLENIEIEELEEKIDVKETKKEIEIVELDEKAIESEKLLEKIDIEKSKKGIEIEELEEKAIEKKSLENIEIENLEEKIDVKETKKGIEIVELEDKAIGSENSLEKIEIEELKDKVDIEKSKKGIEIKKLEKKAIERKKLVKKIESAEKFSLFEKPKDFSELFAKMLPVLVSLVDDNARKTRLYALRAICLMIEIARKLSIASNDNVHEIYPVVLKRLDDGCDDVRIVALEALVVVWGARTKNYDIIFSRNQIDFLYTSAIVHLDDPDKKFQSLMLEAFVELAKIHPELLAKKIENCRGNFRNQAGLDRLLKHCYDLLRERK